MRKRRDIASKPAFRLLRRIDVRAVVGDPARGRLTAGGAAFPCALGPSGIVAAKREGDGGTPRGAHAARRLWRRADRGFGAGTGLVARVTRPADAWCDDPGHRRYNRRVSLPFPASHEVMWREDGLYDLVVELGWNDRPPRPGRGSAIFLHAARPGFPPTAGCVALAPAILRRVLGRMGPRTILAVASPPRRVR
jgi:L,D-peptidoglycan transpeptidase YkuD (ErfK/YbiS/YcfS/YnhG family)